MSEDEDLCAVCLEPKVRPVSIPCGHSFCRECLDKFKAYNKYAYMRRCPLCRAHMGRTRVIRRSNTRLSVSASFAMNIIFRRTALRSLVLGPLIQNVGRPGTGEEFYDNADESDSQLEVGDQDGFGNADNEISYEEQESYMDFDENDEYDASDEGDNEEGDLDTDDEYGNEDGDDEEGDDEEGDDEEGDDEEGEFILLSDGEDFIGFPRDDED